MNGRAAAALVLAVTVAARLPTFLAASERAMSPDEAHFLNVARCVSRGQGFSTPAAWPAWLAPGRLPAPETFKDPALPYAIAAAAPLAGGPFRAGLLIALLSGALLPLAVRGLALRLTGDRATALLAGLLAAASPLLIGLSARALAESPFVLVLMLALWMAAPRPRSADGDDGVPVGGGAVFGAGALLGLAFLTREQALLALPALLALAIAGVSPRVRAGRIGAALAGMLIVASPLLVRNLRLFGAPLHSDATTFFLWPHVDPIAFSHGLDRPPAPLGWMLAHPAPVAAQIGANLFFLVRHSIARELFGQPVWLAAIVIGAALTPRRRRPGAFTWLYLLPLIVTMSAMSWNARYFAAAVPAFALLGAMGTAAVVRRARLDRAPLALAAVIVVIAVLLAAPIAQGWRAAPVSPPPELGAALAARAGGRMPLAPGESVMAITTSYWSWFLDRPSVHLPVADEARVAAIARRYRVRWAALPTSRLAALRARYPGGRLPRIFVPAWTDTLHDLSVFAVRR